MGVVNGTIPAQYAGTRQEQLKGEMRFADLGRFMVGWEG